MSYEMQLQGEKKTKTKQEDVLVPQLLTHIQNLFF